MGKNTKRNKVKRNYRSFKRSKRFRQRRTKANSSLETAIGAGFKALSLAVHTLAGSSMTVKIVSQALLSFLGVPGSTIVYLKYRNKIVGIRAYPDSITMCYEFIPRGYRMTAPYSSGLGCVLYSIMSRFQSNLSNENSRWINKESVGIFGSPPSLNFTVPIRDRILLNCYDMADTVLYQTDIPPWSATTTDYKASGSLDNETVDNVSLTYRSIGLAHTGGETLTTLDKAKFASSFYEKPYFVSCVDYQVDQIPEGEVVFENKQHAERIIALEEAVKSVDALRV